MANEKFLRAKATPIAEREMEVDGEIKRFVKYIGKAESDQGNAAYWLGSSLGKEKTDRYFDTFEDAYQYAKDHIRAEAKLIEVEKF